MQNRTADRTENEVTETEVISYESQKVEDSTIAKGQTSVKQKGVNGTKSIKWKVIYIDGKEANRERVSETVTLAPVTEIISQGTYVAPAPPAVKSSCDPNYTGCVPIASDVDCAGGSGNGPAYVSGPIRVIGSDIYGLDRDGDGIACE